MDSDELEIWHNSTRRSVSGPQDGLFRQIHKALQEGCWLDIIYLGGSSPGERRHIKPLELFQVESFSEIYLRAFCDTRKEERTFRLDKIVIACSEPNNLSQDSNEPLSLEDKVLNLLRTSQGLKARQIATNLGIDRTQVNSLLYGKLRRYVWQDKSYRWRLRTSESQRQTQKEISHKNTPLARLCRYYLDCLSHDDLGGVSVYASSRGELDYVELEILPMLYETGRNPFDSERSQRLLIKIRRDRNRQTVFLGYPVRLRFIRSKKGWEGYRVEPLLLVPFQNTSSKYDTPVLSDDLPQINFQALSSLSNVKETGLITEAIQLAEELGLANVADDQPDIDELVARLREIRSDWDWQEDIEPYALSKGIPLSELNKQGIFNRAILVASERSPYTKGLETELGKLQDVDENNYKTTVLGAWLNTQIIESPQTGQQPLLEVLPLNSEQRQAVRQALSNPLTVITGPPGTGKSQVVTSILVNAAWQGKTVLFASKNNKAVDVVETRVNALGPRPVLLRLGANEYRTRLAEYLLSLLSATATVDDSERYRECEAIHAQLQKRSSDIDTEVRTLIELRNEVDHLEQNVEQFRHEVGMEAFGQLRDIDMEILGQSIENLQVAINRTNKSKQPFWTKLVWSFLCNRRFNELKDTSASFINTSKQIVLPMPEHFPELVTISDWIQYGTLLDNRISQIIAVQQYFSKLETLSNSRSLEDLSHLRKKLTDELAANSEEFWEAWLRLQPSRLTPEQRKLLGDYSALLQMIISADEQDQRIGRDIFRRYYKLFPQITSILSCWAVTSLSTRGRVPFEPNFFDLLVIDEASQCDIASALPLLYRAHRVVIIGDPMQLPHVSALSNQEDQQLLNKHGLMEEFLGWNYSSRSLYHIASSLCKSEDIVNLRDHFRSHSDIIEFSNDTFYQGQLRIATKYEHLKRPWHNEPTVRWINARGKVVRPGTGGALNEDEAQAVVGEIERLVNQRYSGSVGVVSPFRAQANRIRDIVFQHASLGSRIIDIDFLADTVHKFQGDERDVMIFSPVVSTGITDGSLRFLRRNPNLFNVAITRARAALIVVGDKAAALNCNVDYLARFAAYTDKIKNQSQQKEGHAMADLGPEYPCVSNPDQVSQWEHFLYRRLYRAGIRPIPQYQVEKYWLDFAVIMGDRRLNIEIDGERYHRNWDGELCRRDQIRNQRLMELGWDIMRFWVYQVRDDIETCVTRVQRWLRR